MKKLYFPLLVLLAAACDRENCHEPKFVACGVVNPAENIAWLRATIDQYKNDTSDEAKYRYILQAICNGRTVFVFGNCCPYCLSRIDVKDCDGNDVDVKADAPTQTVTVIWQAEQLPCVPAQ